MCVLCIHVSVCAYTYVCMPMHMPVKSRSQCSPHLLKQGFSLNLELPNSAEFVSPQAPETLLSLPPGAGVQACSTTPGFSCGNWRLNSGPHECAASALLTDSHLCLQLVETDLIRLDIIFPTCSYQTVQNTSDSRMYQFGMIGLLVLLKDTLE